MTTNTLAVNSIDGLMRLLTTSGALDLQYSIAHQQDACPELTVELSGPDLSRLTERNGELLHAIEHVAAKLLRLEPEEHDRIRFDAGGYKAARDQELRLSAEAAIARVRSTGTAFAFPPMTSRERRMLHLALQESGLVTASSGIGPRRFVVLYPENDQQPGPAPVVTEDRSEQIRSTFRRR